MKPFVIQSHKFLGTDLKENGEPYSWRYELSFNQSMESTHYHKGIEDGMNAHRHAEMYVIKVASMLLMKSVSVMKFTWLQRLAIKWLELKVIDYKRYTVIIETRDDANVRIGNVLTGNGNSRWFCTQRLAPNRFEIRSMEAMQSVDLIGRMVISAITQRFQIN